MPPKSLITGVRERYLTSLRSVQTPSRWKILVVDSYTQDLLNALFKLNQILNENVSLVDNIQSNRSPQPGFEAAYILTPTSANVERIIQDLAPGNGRQPQYAAGHIFFVDGLSEPLLRRLTSSPAEPKLRQLVELYCNLWALEAQAFSLKTPQSFFTLFQPPGTAFGPDPAEALRAIEDELEFSTQALLNVCVTLNEFPLIRYYNPTHPPLGPLTPPPSAQSSPSAAATLYQGSVRMARLRGDAGTGNTPGAGAANAALGEHFNRRLAMRLQAAIDAYVRDNQPKPDAGRPRAVLFLTDRSMDTVAPFLHEFSYQAMCNDLLKIEDGCRYHYRFINGEGEQEEKDAVLGDEDSVWTAIRHLHIAEAIDKLSKDFASHAGEQGNFSQGSSLNDMRDMLASLPQMQEMKDRLSLHLTMAQECMNRFEKSRLPQQAMVEQNCATRVTPEGQKPRTLVEEMVPLLDDREVSNSDKVRIIALYIMYSEGVPDEDRKRLFQHARLGLSEMDAVNNLVHLGAKVVKDPMNGAWDAWFKKGKRRQVAGENEYELSRYQPLVKLMLEDHVAGKLDQGTYPYVRDAPPDLSGGLVSSAMGVAGGRDSPLVKVGLGTTSSTAPSSGTSLRSQPSSLRSAKPTWHQKARVGASSNGGMGSVASGAGNSASDRFDAKRQRLIVFVAGGMTYSEVRSAYACSEKLGKDVYIGSSHTITPESFIHALSQFGKPGNTPGSASTPSSGHSSSRGGGHPHHSHSHAQGQAQAHGYGTREAYDQTNLPSGATHLSKPSNDRSGLRSMGAKLRGGSADPPRPGGVGTLHASPHVGVGNGGLRVEGGGGGGYGGSLSHDSPYGGTAVAGPRSPATYEANQGIYDRRYGGKTNGGGISPPATAPPRQASHEPQLGGNRLGGNASPHLAPQGVAPHLYAQGQSQALGQGLGLGGQDLRAESPAPSTGAGSGASRERRKGLKMPFFRKG